jgi:membrane-bound lytic murein transglycosylase F
MSALALLLLTLSATPDSMEWELTRHTRERYAGDLAEIKKRGVLRVLTRNNSSAYFIAKGEQRGFQFELAQELAKELGVRVAIVVPPSRDNLIASLLDGEGDVIAAGMTVTPAREEKVLFTYPVLEAPRVLVTHPLTVKTLEKPEDLSQFAVHLSFNSTTRATAKALEERLGFPLLLRDVSDGVEMEEMMARVATGEYEATIVDKDLYELERAAGVEIDARLDVSEPLPKAWAFRKSSPELHAFADKFIRKHRKSGLIKILYDRYYRPSRTAMAAHEMDQRADHLGSISPYDELFKREAEANALDWRLVAAVAFTESRFDPNAKSAWGAVGLMQVLPSTAKEVGVQGDLTKPENNVRAGVRYLKRLISAFEETLEPRQRVRFAIAGYNAGLGHVFDARAIAAQIGKNRDRWFANVEEALKLKKQPKWHEKTKFGYCRADETVGYVSRVQARYDVFVRHVPEARDEKGEVTANAPAPPPLEKPQALKVRFRAP